MSILETIDRAGKISEAITLADAIGAHFPVRSLSIHTGCNVSGTSKVLSTGIATVRGKLNLSHQNIVTTATADCSLCVPLDWPQTPPALRCTASWIRRPDDPTVRADWHVNQDNSLCYVLDREWYDCLADIQPKKPHLIIQCAAFYCVNNARWLLYRHLEGYRRRLKHWPAKEWICWSHSIAGLRAYLAQRNRHSNK